MALRLMAGSLAGISLHTACLSYLGTAAGSAGYGRLLLEQASAMPDPPGLATRQHRQQALSRLRLCMASHLGR